MVQNLTCVKSIIYNSVVRFSKVYGHINFFNGSCNQNVLKKSLDEHLKHIKFDLFTTCPVLNPYFI